MLELSTAIGVRYVVGSVGTLFMATAYSDCVFKLQNDCIAVSLRKTLHGNFFRLVALLTAKMHCANSICIYETVLSMRCRLLI